MSDIHPAPLSATTRDDLRRPREPFHTPLDVLALVMIVLMICGPLVAGALRQ